MKKHEPITLHVTVAEDRVASFTPLLTKGFMVKTKVGCSVQEMICRHLGLGADYLEHRIQTIFLDGKAVDRVEDAVVDQNATLALSAAMPGLAGATLRRGGAYASMRRQITHKGCPRSPMIKDGTITLKLFNLVAKDIGPVFLTQGIWVNGEDVQRLFRKAPQHFRKGCRAVRIDGTDSTVDDLFDIEWEGRLVFLKLICETV